MFGLLKRFVFDEQFARRVLVTTALGVGGLIAAPNGPGADLADLLGPTWRAIIAAGAIAAGGIGAVQGNGSAPKH